MRLFAVLCLVGLALAVLAAGARTEPTPTRPPKAGYPPPGADAKVQLSAVQWRERLSSQEFHVLREQGTERAFSGDLWNHHDAGTYVCAGCGLPLFESSTKFDSGTGWPSYWQPIDGAVETEMDHALGMTRVEAHCARCGGHLGHVFTDGPKPTGLRYCINSVSLDFQPTASGPDAGPAERGDAARR